MMEQRRSREAVKREAPSAERSRSRSRGRDRSRDRPAGARVASKRVYISNIPYDSRWQDIKDLFRKEIGEIAFVELFSDETDKPRGCGIIEFETPASAKKAIEKMHRFEMGGRKIVVKEDYDVQRDKSGRIVTGTQPGGGQGQGQVGGQGGGGRRDDNRGGGGGGGGRDHDRGGDHGGGEWNQANSVQNQSGGGNWKYGNTYGLSAQFLESLGIEGPLISRVFVSNLDFRVDEKKLKEVFRLAGRVLDVELNKDKEGKSRGHCVIEFEHPVEAVQAISMLNNQQLFERRMHVKMDRLADPLSDLAKNKLPEGLKGIGMGLGMNGQPLVDVAISVAKNDISSTAGVGNGSVGATTNMTTPIVAAMNLNPAMGNLATLMANQSSMDMSNNAAAAAALSNAFGVAGIGQQMSAMNAAANQFAQANNAGNIAAALQNSGVGMGGLQGSQGIVGMMGSGGGAQMSNAGGGMPGANIGTAAGSQAQPSPFQTNQGSAQQNANAGFRDMDFGGYAAAPVYSTPGTNYNTAYQREKQQFNNGTSQNIGGGGGGAGDSGTSSNTVIVANLPQTCTWQMLKAKFRECGEVVFAEMRDKNTGIVRFAQERDAARAVKVYDQSRVDGRIVDVRFL